jgi:archaellum component FlaC
MGARDIRRRIERLEQRRDDLLSDLEETTERIRHLEAQGAEAARLEGEIEVLRAQLECTREVNASWLQTAHDIARSSLPCDVAAAAIARIRNLISPAAPGAGEHPWPTT